MYILAPLSALANGRPPRLAVKARRAPSPQVSPLHSPSLALPGLGKGAMSVSQRGNHPSAKLGAAALKRGLRFGFTPGLWRVRIFSVRSRVGLPLCLSVPYCQARPARGSHIPTAKGSPPQADHSGRGAAPPVRSGLRIFWECYGLH